MDRILIKKERDRSVSKRYEKAVLNGLNDIDYEINPYGVYEKNDKGYHEIITYTYNGDDSFWRGFSNSYGETIVENCSDNTKREKFIYNTDLSKKFISLERFIENGEFIGQIGYRIKPLMKPLNNYDICLDVDYSYMEKDNYIVLYKYNGKLLVFNTDSRKYELISSKYTYDNNFKFIGPVHYDMADKNKIIDDIYNQLNRKVKIKRR